MVATLRMIAAWTTGHWHVNDNELTFEMWR
jgi:hypothetical protein